MTKIFILIFIWGKIWETYRGFDVNVIDGIHALMVLTAQTKSGTVMGYAAVNHFMVTVNLPLDWTLYILQFTFERCAGLDPMILQQAIEIVKEAYSNHNVSPTWHTFGLDADEWIDNHWRDPTPPAEPDKDLSYYVRTWHFYQPYPKKTKPKGRRRKR